MTGLDKRNVAGGSRVDVEAAGDYELPLHQLGSGSGSDDDDDEVKATAIPSRGHSFDTGNENRRRLL
jgi:hypothetical protein